MRQSVFPTGLFALLILLAACQMEAPPQATDEGGEQAAAADLDNLVSESLIPPERLEIYAPVKLTGDLGALSAEQRHMLKLLIEASRIMDDLFWRQAYGDRDALLAGIADPALRRFADINYGPWDRLDGDLPFLPGYGPKPPGANFYPPDMTPEEFDAWDEPAKTGLYSLVRRDDEGRLHLQPYHIAYQAELNRAAELLRRAADLAVDADFAEYLRLRATALVTDDYQPSDMAWMEVKNNPIELVIGPIETYEDQLFGYRAAYEAYVLIKDQAWSERLARFARYLPGLQRSLPVADAYRAESPGSSADLNAYDVIFYAGHSNAGSKTIAINLPNDEEVQLQKGTRRLQLKNAMRAKFDKIMLPIAGQLIAAEQQANVTFEAFFQNTMFHEVAHGLGIKNTIDGSGTVREALREQASALEEGKADILGLYMIEQLRALGEALEGGEMDNDVTFLAGIFRSVRFGASSAHGMANMVRFNYFKEQGAFSRDSESGRYRVEPEAFRRATASLAGLILTLQGNGDYDGVRRLFAEKGVIDAELQADLDRLAAAAIPVDVVFEQGEEVLGL